MGQIAPIRLGVIGAGVMGGYHIRVAARLPGCQLLGIFDLDSARAEQLAGQYGVTLYPSIEALCAAVDAVILASPTATHASIASSCLQAGCHVLVEKPIDGDIAAAKLLVETSRQHNDRVLMIGHLERFNPAITLLRSLLPHEELFAFELQRLSPTPPRDRSADIIFDLMIHDLDLALALSDSKVVSVNATGHRLRYKFIDHVTALLRFANGVTATLTASALSQQRLRSGRFYTTNAQYSVDLTSHELWIHRYAQSTLLNEAGARYNTTTIEQIPVPNTDALTAEQEHFVLAIRNGHSPLTNAESGLQVLALAQAIQNEVNEQLSHC